jgi:hypothetical protein
MRPDVDAGYNGTALPWWLSNKARHHLLEDQSGILVWP